jgi:hypothetical protein
VVAAAGEFGVEPVEDLGRDRADTEVSDQRCDVFAEVAAVAGEGVVAGAQGREVTVQQVGESSAGVIPNCDRFVC